VNKMTEDDTMNQMTDVLSRLESRLDSMEKGEKPAFLEDKKDESKDEKAESKDDKKKSDTEYSDVITSDYLNWMEDTLKSAGVDTMAARAHFDGDSVAKQNMGSTPGELQGSDVTNGGQAPLRQQEGGNPSTGAIPKLNSGGDVKKSDFLNPTDLDASDVEAAYEVYKAAALEQEFRSSLENDFATRYQSERAEEIAKAEAASYDARGPLDAITKAIAELSERIDSIGTPAEVGETLQKSAAPQHEVPSTSDLAQMSWDEVHQLAGRVFEGE